MACGCNKNRVNKTNSQLRREARRAEAEAQKQAQKIQETQDGKVPASANG
jgi:hypothetical protein